MDRANRPDDLERDEEQESERSAGTPGGTRDDDREAPNPPRTTTGNMTAPKFGSATSGGGEFEPGPEQD